MKQLTKSELKKVAYNCRRATYLIEKKLLDSTTAREEMILRIHLAGCSVCRIFEKQSITINRMVKELFNTDIRSERKLDDGFKKGMQKRIEEKLNSN